MSQLVSDKRFLYYFRLTTGSQLLLELREDLLGLLQAAKFLLERAVLGVREIPLDGGVQVSCCSSTAR